MNDEILSLIEQMQQGQNNTGVGASGVQQLSKGLLNSNNGFQAIQKLGGTSSQIANNMVAQGQQQTQEAIQGKNALQNQRDNLMSQAEQQANNALQQNQQQGSGLGTLLKIGAMIASGGGSAAAEGTAGSAVGSQLADMSWKKLGSSGALSWL